MTKKTYELESSIGYLIFIINQSMHSFFRKKLDQEGVNVVETWILLQILNGIKTGKELKNVLRVDMAQIQRGCDRLVKDKLVVRSVDPFDRRVKILSLSKEGEALIKKLIQHSKKTNAKFLMSLNKEQQDELRNLLIEVLNNPFFNFKADNEQ